MQSSRSGADPDRGSSRDKGKKGEKKGEKKADYSRASNDPNDPHYRQHPTEYSRASRGEPGQKYDDSAIELIVARSKAARAEDMAIRDRELADADATLNAKALRSQRSYEWRAQQEDVAEKKRDTELRRLDVLATHTERIGAPRLGPDVSRQIGDEVGWTHTRKSYEEEAKRRMEEDPDR